MYIESIITKWIITNIARGLSYVRRECRQVIAYLDIKPHKILLDDSFNTKFTDYLLPKLIKMDKNGVITRMRNAPGCMVPEWLPSQISNRSVKIVTMHLEIVCSSQYDNPTKISEPNHFFARKKPQLLSLEI
jgi:serine/threonine protein kinase